MKDQRRQRFVLFPVVSYPNGKIIDIGMEKRADGFDSGVKMGVTKGEFYLDTVARA